MSEEIIDVGTKRFVKVVEYLNSPDIKPLAVMGIVALGLYLIERRGK